MSRRLSLGLGAGLGVALVAVWLLLDAKVDRLDAALGRELERVEKLDGLLRDAGAQIDHSYRRIDEARLRRESASRRIDAAESAVAAAAEERTAADSLTEDAQAREQAARQEALEARRQAEAERRKREEEWARLGRALAKVAPTRQGPGVLTAELPPGFVDDKEKISRLAGILLAHHGYRASVEGAGAAAAESYLRAAGIPADILSRGQESGKLRLVVRDQIGAAPQF